ncbi:MAG: SRPBCC family protein, partial [Candidatus Nitrosotenuis sp.]
MTHTVLAHAKDGHRIAKVTQSITIDVVSDKVWAKISNIAGLAEWVEGVKNTTYTSKKRRGLGASRKIFFDNGEQVTEYIVGWNDGKYLSYIATDGLPLDGYHATLS